ALPGPLRQMLQSLPPAQRAAMNDPQGLISSQAQEAIRSSFARFGAQGQTLYEQFVHAVRVGLDHGMGEIFTVGLVVAILAFLSTFLLPEIGLKHDEFFDMDEAPLDRGEPGDVEARERPAERPAAPSGAAGPSRFEPADAES
ncbi:MAG: hypothetical protein P8Y02_13720, partial [Deinococcales bacterium]